MARSSISSVVDEGTRHVDRASRFLGGFRWVFMPLGLVALIAVGSHAAANAVDERVLRIIEAIDTFFDGWFAQHELTANWVEVIGARERMAAARVLALAWELATDVILLWPALGYREHGAPSVQQQASHWKQMVLAIKEHPTTMRVVRPLATFAIVLAGACSVAQMIRGAIYLSGRSWMGDGLAGLLSRLLAIAVLAGVVGSLGWRAVLQSLRDAHQVSAEDVRTRSQALRVGLIGSLIVLPLGIVALIDASPLLSFIR